jgi:hypothetical protein
MLLAALGLMVIGELRTYAATLLTSSAAQPYRMDTTGPAYAITNEAGRTSLWPLTYRKGASVTATAPNGTATTLVTAAASDGTLSWTPATGGGAWTLANPKFQRLLRPFLRA